MTAPFFLRRPVFNVGPPDNTGGLAGYWPFDGDAIDYSGNSKNGTINGTPKFESGIVRDGLSFSGASTQYVSFPTNTVSSNVLTVCLWAYFNAINAYQGLFSIATNDSNSMEIFLNNANARLFGGNFNNQALTAISSIATGRWYHVGLTSDGTTTRLFLDGARNGTTGTTNFSTFSVAGAIAARTGGSFLFNGRIDDARLYSRVLADAEINAIYHLGLSGPDEGEMPALNTSAAFLAAWARQSNSPVLGVGHF